MRTWPSLAVAVMAILLSTPVMAADLTKIDRTIAKEPVYNTKPKYCLLVFGPEAKTRVWLVQDGDVLYVDRNGNGDLTETGERVTLPEQRDKEYRSFQAGDIHDGPLVHTGLSVTQMLASPQLVGNGKEFARIKGQNPKPWIWTVGVAAERSADDKRPVPKQIKYIANGDGQGFLLFADQPQHAPIIHFNGPWTLGLQDVKQLLKTGHDSMLQIGVGTQGIGPGTFTFVLYPNTIPPDAYPVADITFPSKSPDLKPLKKKFTLSSRC